MRSSFCFCKCFEILCHIGNGIVKIDSMVEIIRPEGIKSSSSLHGLEDSLGEDKHRLVYSKSKVYVNPTAYARDNIPGFVALVKQVCDLQYHIWPQADRSLGGPESEASSCVDPRVVIE